MFYDPQNYWDIRSRLWVGEKEPHITKIIKPFICGESVVDIGCGHGRFYPLFKNLHYLGIDIAEPFLLRFSKKYPKAKLLQADIRNLRLPNDERFDLGFSYTVLEHIPPEDIGLVQLTMELLASRWLIIEPEIPIEKTDKLAEHCFRHDYDNLFNVKTKILLDKPLVLWEVIL